ncbi:uncharacterized protein LOC143125657 [Alosa pseudoharengus]|uniref:uncharacterized protein LOC143125657 n=1 Tax=Alosa pseudoharengus TaxID=34774 RepID=UPI003F8C952C
MSSQTLWWRQALILSVFLLIPRFKASLLVAIINTEPLDGNSAEVRAHFSVIAPLPCPSLLDSVCNDGNSSCIAHTVPSPLQGSQPSPGWCVRQWQNTVPSQHSSNINLGSDGVVLSTRADLSTRKDTRKMNRPPFSALIPPIRVNTNCSHDIPLSVYDLDGDRVRCRYARDDLGECYGNCPQHAFFLLDEASCTLRYIGGASEGQYSVKLMVEDFPVPKPFVQMEEKAFSSNPIFLSITVENKLSDCSVLPVFVDESPDENAMISVLPYEEVKFNVTIRSEAENVLEMAIAGPPSLYISPLQNTQESEKSVTLAWVRGPNDLSRLLSICFTANTDSLQSEIRCIWLQQRPMSDLPAGTELNCTNSTMSLVLPISTMSDLPLDDLQLNDPSCAVFHNTTHVTASFSLSSCGTKTVHSGSELVYTNTLRSTGVSSPITRRPMLILPLACRIAGREAQGPHYKVIIPIEEKVFGKVSFWLEFHRPGEGPLGNLTRIGQFRRFPREARVAMNKVNRLEELDLYVFSNSSKTQAQLLMGGCKKSETEDFADASPIVENGCKRDNKSLEILIQTPTIKVYRLNLAQIQTVGNTMYVECTVSLCVTTQATDKCPGPCDPVDPNVLVTSILSSEYTVRSGPVLLLDREVPATTTVPITTTPLTTTTTTPTTTPTTTTVATTAANTTASSASKRTSSLAAGVIIVVFHMVFLCLLH